VQFGGQFRLSANRVNGWGVIGIHDNNNTQNLGNIGSNYSRLAGGVLFPFDVEVVQLVAWHRNNNADALAWGWELFFQEKTNGTNGRVSTTIISEVADAGGVGPRDYQNSSNQYTDIDLTGVTNKVVSSENVICLGAAAPTAVASNRTVQVMAGCLLVKPILST